MTSGPILLCLQKAWTLNDAVVGKLMHLGVQGPKDLLRNTYEYIKYCNSLYNHSRLEKIARRVLKREDYMKTLYQEMQEVFKKEGMEKGMEKGREKGREEGIKESKIETAHNLLKMGLEPEKILKATGLPKKILLTLKRSS